MRGTVIYAPGDDVRVEQRDDPKIIQPTDVIIRLAATFVCGSDLWAYRGIESVEQPTPMGHESRCAQVEFVGAGGAQAEYLRVPLADGTLVATSAQPDADLVPSLLAASDVLGTGWFGAVAADVRPGRRSRWWATARWGCSPCSPPGSSARSASSRWCAHESRQKPALACGATDIVTELGDEGVAQIKEMTGGYGAHSVAEAVRTQESMVQAIRSARPGGHGGHVGIAHGVELPGEEVFYAEVHLLGGPAPVPRFLPGLIRLIDSRGIDPGQVFDLSLPLDQAAEGYRAMDERRSVKTLLSP